MTAFFSDRAEASVLAALMQDEDLAREISSLNENDFYIPENRDLFNAMQQLCNLYSCCLTPCVGRMKA